MTNAIGLFYGSTTGNTEAVAQQIAQLIGDRVDLHDVAREGVVAALAYERLIMGIPTWDFGELQEDWEANWDALAQLDFSGRKVALFGIGDQLGYGEWFLDAMGRLGELICARGGELVGYWPVEGYTFEASKAVTPEGTHFVGLALDEDGQASQTEARIAAWVPQVLAVFDNA